MLSLDRAIGKLYDRFGDRVDGKADFVDAEERRFGALERLARMPARSAAGLVAKANAIKTLDEDTDRQAAIAASLADDVLRHFTVVPRRSGARR